MKTFHQVLLLSSPDNTYLQPLEQLFDSEPDFKMKFISPEKVFKTDFIESEFIILDYDYYLKNQDELQMALQYPEKLSIFATLSNNQQMIEILKKTQVSHLFGMAGAQTLKDIKAHLIASMRNEFLISENFITPPITNHSHASFQSSENLDQQIESAIQPHDLSSTFHEFRQILIHIINEGLTNALYNAPINLTGEFLHRGQNRRDGVVSEQKMCPALDIMEDEEKIIISIKDFYGTLTKNVIDQFLTKGEVVEKAGGAGVGMFLILKNAHKLIINIDPGKMTEFIVVLHKFKRFFHYQTLEKSYHLYQRKLP